MAEKIQINSRKVYESVNRLFDHIYKLNNSYIFDWESDYFGIAKSSGYCYEIEVKISRSDYKADFRKSKKHRFLQSRGELSVFRLSPKYERIKSEDAISLGHEIKKYEDGKEYVSVCTSTGINFKNPTIPNRFFYACPENLINKSEVPDYAGLIYTNGYRTDIIKPAPLLHKIKHNLRSLLLDKFYYAYLNELNKKAAWKRNFLELQKKYDIIEESEYQQALLDF